MKRKNWLKITATLLLAGILTVTVSVCSKKDVSVFVPSRLPERTLIIDAGHGGEDGGAVSPNGTVESHINLEVALRLKGLADLYGLRSQLLRESDISLHDADCHTLREKKVSDLRNRVSTIESIPNAILISIHQNIFQNPKYHGAQVFFRQDDESRSLADTAQKMLQFGLDPENNRVPTAIPTSVYLMNHITHPAILVECGFLSNPQEETQLKTPEYQTKLAAALISAYLTHQQR